MPEPARGERWTIYVCPECGGPAYLWDETDPYTEIEPAWIYRCPLHEVWGRPVEVVRASDFAECQDALDAVEESAARDYAVAQHLRKVMLDAATKLEQRGNEESRAVAIALRSAALPDKEKGDA
jgi:hypothetical protein